MCFRFKRILLGLGFFFAIALAESEADASSRQDACLYTRSCREDPNRLRWFKDQHSHSAVWSPFGIENPGSKQLADWVRTATSQVRIPKFDNRLSLNCWEYVLYTGLRIGTMDLTQVQRLYETRLRGESLSKALGATIGIGRYSVIGGQVKIEWPKNVQAHDVVFMDETSHVVQFLGEKSATDQELVVSFSPRPIWGDGSQERPVESVSPEVTTVESLIEQLVDLYPDVPTDWENINLQIIRPRRKERP